MILLGVPGAAVPRPALPFVAEKRFNELSSRYELNLMAFLGISSFRRPEPRLDESIP